MYIKMGLLKECPPGTVKNPLTGRCVSKTGKLGKSLIKNVTFQTQKPKSPRKIFPSKQR